MDAVPIKENNFPKSAFIHLLDLPVIYHVSKIRCGSYSTEWIASSIGLHPNPSNNLLRGPVWYDIFRPVVPTDMMRLFRFRGMDCMEISLEKLTDEERILWVKNEIITKRIPPALLIRTKILHWIAVGGYDDESKVFFIYDSRYGDSSVNPHFPIGNNTIPYDVLTKVWRGRWWMKYKAIVVIPKNSPTKVINM